MPETKIAQVPDYRFSSTDWPIVSVRVRIADIANRFGFQIDRWEDELGPTCGIWIRLPSQRVMLLQEFEHAIKHLGANGPTISVDARDLADLGVRPLVDEALATLDLSRDDTDWIAPDEAQTNAADLLRWWAESIATRNLPGNDEPFKR